MAIERDTYLELVEEASHYEWDDVVLFIAEHGWRDWMLDYLDDPEEEMLGLWDTRRINDVLLDAFEEAHNKRFCRLERKHLWDL